MWTPVERGVVLCGLQLSEGLCYVDSSRARGCVMWTPVERGVVLICGLQLSEGLCYVDSS